MDKVERFKRRQTQKKIINERMLHIVPDESLINQHLTSSVDDQLVNEIEYQLDLVYKFEYNVDVSNAEIEELLTVLEKNLMIKNSIFF